MLILLNGCTSSGKSSIAKSLQFLSKKPLLHMGVDTFWDMVPRHYADKPLFQSEEEKQHTLYHKEEAYLDHLFMVIPEVLKTLLMHKVDVIMDDVLYNKATRLLEYVKYFDGFNVYFVGVHCDKDVQREREILRGDRRIGQGAYQLKTIHAFPRFYDIEIDTTHQTPMKCGEIILNYIKDNPSPRSFLKLKEALLS